MTKTPLITTVIPTYKRPNQLKASIRSALNQTFTEIEVWVFDNASNDETAKIVDEIGIIDSRLKYYCHPKEIAAAENFQFGISSVKTPFFSVLSDDDLLAPHFYKVALSSLSRYPKASFFLGSTLDVNDNGSLISANALDWEEDKLYEPPSGLYKAINHYFNWTGALFRSDIMTKVQLDLSIKPIDLDFILRSTAQCSFVVSKKPCALFIHHKKSYSSMSGLKLVWPSWLKIIQNIESIATLSDLQKSEAKDLMLSKLRKILLRIAISLASSKQYEQTRATLKVLSNEFPEDRSARIFSSILIRIEKNRLFFWVLRNALFTYRFIKTASMQSKFGKFAKKLIRTSYTAPAHLE